MERSGCYTAGCSAVAGSCRGDTEGPATSLGPQMSSQPPVTANQSRVSIVPIIPVAQKTSATELRTIEAIAKQLTIPDHPNQLGTTPALTNRAPKATTLKPESTEGHGWTA